jgi:hypothetical protein
LRCTKTVSGRRCGELLKRGFLLLSRHRPSTATGLRPHIFQSFPVSGSPFGSYVRNS